MGINHSFCVQQGDTNEKDESYEIILLKVNQIFRILLLLTENAYLPSRIKVELKSDISSQHKINVGPLRVINTYYVLDTGPITINLLSGSQFFMEESVNIQFLDLSGFYGHVYFSI